MVPEIYHSHLPPGTVLGTDTEGKTKGNDLKKLTPMSTFDNDCEVLVQALKSYPACNGRVGAIGFCKRHVVKLRISNISILRHRRSSCVPCVFEPECSRQREFLPN